MRHLLSIFSYFILFSFISKDLSAQVHKVDSLKNLLSKPRPLEERLGIELKLSNAYKRTFPDSSLYYAKRIIESTATKTGANYATLQVEALMISSAIYFMRNMLEKMKEDIETALGLSRQYGLKVKEAKSLIQLGIYHQKIGPPDRDKELFEEALKVLGRTTGRSEGEKKEIKRTKSRVYSNLGGSLFLESRYYEAIEAFRKALTLKDVRHWAGMVNRIGLSHQFTENLDSALAYYIKANELMNLYGSTVYEKIYNQMLLTDVWIRLGQYERAIALLKETRTSAEQNGFHEQFITASNTLTGALIHVEKYSEAMTIAKETYRLADSLQETYQKYIALEYLSEIEECLDNLLNAYNYNNEGLVVLDKVSDYGKAKVTVRLKNYDLGKKLGIKKSDALWEAELMEMLALTDSCDFMEEKVVVEQILSEFYASIGDYEQAYAFAKTHRILQDSLHQMNTEKAINNATRKLDALYRERSEELNEVKLAKAELSITARTQQLRLSLSLLALLMIGLFFTYRNFNLKKKTSAVIFEKNKLLQAQKAQLDEMLKERDRELMAKAILISEREKFLQDINKLLKNLKSYISDSGQATGILNELAKQVEQSKHLSESWDSLRLHFERVHPNFFKKLIDEQKQALTQNELKHCAYLYMNLSIKETARLTNVTPKAVEKARYRLKKKMGLELDQNLFQFLASL